MFGWCIVCCEGVLYVRVVYCMLWRCNVCYCDLLYVRVVYCVVGRCTVW